MTERNGTALTTKDLIGMLNLPSGFPEAVKEQLELVSGNVGQIVGAYAFQLERNDSRIDPKSKWELILLTHDHLFKMLLDNESIVNVVLPVTAIKAIRVTAGHYIGRSQHSLGNQWHWALQQQVEVFFYDGYKETAGPSITVPHSNDKRDDEDKDPLVKLFLKGLKEAGIPINPAH